MKKPDKIAGEEEVLEYLTKVMRRSDEEIKFSDTFKAAELLGKHYGLFSDKDTQSNDARVIIVDNIPRENNGVQA